MADFTESQPKDNPQMPMAPQIMNVPVGQHLEHSPDHSHRPSKLTYWRRRSAAIGVILLTALSIDEGIIHINDDQATPKLASQITPGLLYEFPNNIPSKSDSILPSTTHIKKMLTPPFTESNQSTNGWVETRVIKSETATDAVEALLKFKHIPASRFKHLLSTIENNVENVFTFYNHSKLKINQTLDVPIGRTELIPNYMKILKIVISQRKIRDKEVIADSNSSSKIPQVVLPKSTGGNISVHFRQHPKPLDNTGGTTVKQPMSPSMATNGGTTAKL